MWEKPVLLPPRVSDVSQQALLLLPACVCVCVSEKVRVFFVCAKKSVVCAHVPVWLCGRVERVGVRTCVCVCVCSAVHGDQRTVGGLPLWILSVFFSKNDIPKPFHFFFYPPPFAQAGSGERPKVIKTRKRQHLAWRAAAQSRRADTKSNTGGNISS